MTEKMNFYDWHEWQECTDEEREEVYKDGKKPSTKWIRDYVRNGAWSPYRFLEPVHDGDCTNCPYTCNLCCLESLLREYREYYFSKD